LFYSLKNSSFPEQIYNTESGVMSIDIHFDYPNIIAAGFYDGTVGVYNTAENTQTPKFMSSAKNGKHTDPVWQVNVFKNFFTSE
jgi:dynein intermediate chain 1, axonemal